MSLAFPSSALVSACKLAQVGVARRCVDLVLEVAQASFFRQLVEIAAGFAQGAIGHRFCC